MDKIEEYINTTDKKEYINNIEVFRFIFACSIVACHILGISTKNFLVYNNFKFIYNNSLHLWMSVELFFIISGFFFIYTYKPKQSWLDFFKAKIIRLWPVMIFTILHFPCATTLLTIKKETGSIKWTLISFLLPTLCGVVICMVTTAIYNIFV